MNSVIDAIILWCHGFAMIALILTVIILILAVIQSIKEDGLLETLFETMWFILGVGIVIALIYLPYYLGRWAQ